MNDLGLKVKVIHNLESQRSHVNFEQDCSNITKFDTQIVYGKSFIIKAIKRRWMLVSVANRNIWCLVILPSSPEKFSLILMKLCQLIVLDKKTWQVRFQWPWPCRLRSRSLQSGNFRKAILKTTTCSCMWTSAFVFSCLNHSHLITLQASWLLGTSCAKVTQNYLTHTYIHPSINEPAQCPWMIFSNNTKGPQIPSEQSCFVCTLLNKSSQKPNTYMV